MKICPISVHVDITKSGRLFECRQNCRSRWKSISRETVSVRQRSDPGKWLRTKDDTMRYMKSHRIHLGLSALDFFSLKNIFFQREIKKREKWYEYQEYLSIKRSRVSLDSDEINYSGLIESSSPSNWAIGERKDIVLDSLEAPGTSKRFPILYRNEEVTLGTSVLFRAHVLVHSHKIEEALSRTHFNLGIELWFSEHTQPGNMACVSSRWAL